MAAAPSVETAFWPAVFSITLGAFALVNTGILAAMVFSGPIGTWVGDRWGWRMAFAATGVIGATALLAQFLAIPRLRRSASVFVYPGLIGRT